jgi:hypothetical protein
VKAVPTLLLYSRHAPYFDIGLMFFAAVYIHLLDQCTSHQRVRQRELACFKAGAFGVLNKAAKRQ